MTQKSTSKSSLRVLITLGPTRAYLDRVRFISNYSTGELGFRLAEKLLKRGVDVFIVAGPTAQPFSKLKTHSLIEVETADQMHEAVLKGCRTFKPHYAVFAAAVLDFQPQKIFSGKVKSSNKVWSVQLVPTPKIIDEVGRLFPEVRRIGFKLEWDLKKNRDLKSFASDLIKRKKLEAVCINFLPQINQKAHPAWFFSKEGLSRKGKTKEDLAKLLTDFVIQQVALR